MKKPYCQLQKKPPMTQKQIEAKVYTLVTELTSNLGRCRGTACNDNPVFCSCFAGQDIKSDGFSIETCKIMVDLLDVSFKAVPLTIFFCQCWCR